MAMVALEAVTKTFGGRTVIRPTTLAIEKGERLALIGPSGCGKSTLLKMVLGLVVPDAGHVKVAGTEVTPASARSVRRRIGTVMQDGGLFPHLSAEDNITLLARLDGWERTRIDARIAELLEIARLPKTHLARHPRELSGGERQRASMMRALFLDPDVLLLDEPLGALDPIVRAKLQEDLRAVFRDLGKTVLFVTHDMAEAAYLADSIAVVSEGEVLQRGVMRDLVDSPAHPFVRELVSAQRSLAEAIA